MALISHPYYARNLTDLGGLQENQQNSEGSLRAYGGDNSNCR